MEHYVKKQNEMVHCPASEYFQSDTQFHIGMLVQPVSQQCKWSIVAALVDRGNLPHLLVHYVHFQLPFQHAVAVFQ